MHIIHARNVNDALPQALDYLKGYGQPMRSRGGDVIVSPYPVSIVYQEPRERVLFHPARDANPFFHIFESLWMLAGRNDVAFPASFVKRMKEYSDDGNTLHGAYGYRWRKHFGYDQLDRIVNILQKDQFSRRAVLTMWDPRIDLTENGDNYKDLPCNQQVMFRVGFGKRDEPNRLNVMVTQRSGDLVWGTAGSNVVHFSVLQEYLAARLGLVSGTLTQVVMNFHAYLKVFEPLYEKMRLHPATDPYVFNTITSYQLIENPKTWDRDLALFMEDPSAVGFDNIFFSRVAKPLWWAHTAYKKKDYETALDNAARCAAQDWRLAAKEWLLRHSGRKVM